MQFENQSAHHEMSKIGSSEDDANHYRRAIEMNCSQVSKSNSEWKFLLNFMNQVVMDFQTKYLHDMNKLNVNHIPGTHVLEQWRMHKYDERKHFYKPHVDSENSASSNRMLAFLFYLNTVPQGGQTAFTDHLEGIECKPLQGRLLVCPTWMAFPHEAKPVIEGNKYMLKTYLHYPWATNIE
jgi:hypothetical protein